jgi:exopolysaccharide biosynthesis polyprenyl glycosylphosphotransferase
MNERILAGKAFNHKVERASRLVPRVWQWRLLFGSLALSDTLALALAFRLAYFIRFELGLNFFYLQNIPTMARYQQLVLVLMPILITLYFASGLYDRHYLLGGTQEYSRAFNATTVGMFTVIAFGFLDPTFIVARGWLFLAWGFAILFVLGGRFGLRRVVYGLRRAGFFVAPAVIVGANVEGRSLARQLLPWKSSGLHILGFVDEKLPAGTILEDTNEPLPILGAVDQLDRLIPTLGVEELILASSAISSREKMLEIFKLYGVGSQVNVRMSSGLYEIITTGLRIQEFAYVPLVGVNQVRLTGIDMALKFLLDYTLALIGLIPFLLAYGALALAIKLDSPGPVIHRRRVLGVNGKQFDAFKFRTMRVDGDALLAARPDLQAELAANHKLKDDPRVTRMGALLRKTSLDELPQLLNVLRGEMSLVGPRMIAPDEIDKYDHWDINLLTVRPGISGLWQVSGRSDISYDQRVQLDMHYIRNWSIWLDIQILLQTIPAVLQRRGAY